jgi:hypothetical protein
VELVILLVILGSLFATFRIALPVFRESRAIRRAEQLQGSISVEDMWPPWATQLLEKFKVRAPKRLTSLRLRGADEVDWLVGCDGLQHLSLQKSRVSDSALFHITTIPTLTSLDLSGAVLTDAGLRSLSRSKSLQDLCLSNTAAGDECAVAISQLSELNSLSLENTEITDAGLVHLISCKSLRVLFLSRTMVGDVGVREVCQELPLVGLFLDHTSISAESVDTLSRTTSLKHIRLDSTQLDAGDFAKLKKALPRSIVSRSGPMCLEYHQRHHPRGVAHGPEQAGY